MTSQTRQRQVASSSGESPPPTNPTMREPPAWMAEAARRWLEDAGATVEGGPDRAFNALPLSGVRVSLAERGRAVCSLRVPAHLTVSSFPASPRR